MPGLCLQGVELVRFGSLDRAWGGHLEGYLRKYSNGGQIFHFHFLVRSCLECRNIKQQPMWRQRIEKQSYFNAVLVTELLDRLEQQYPEFL